MLKVFMCMRTCVWFLCDVHVSALHVMCMVCCVCHVRVCVCDACVCISFQPVMNFPAFTALVQSFV